jgi:hypothetical protein
MQQPSLIVVNLLAIFKHISILTKMNMHIDTLVWLNNQLDKIHSESVKYGELLLGAIDKLSVDFYNQKLAELENEHEVITRKIWKEKEIIESQYE